MYMTQLTWWSHFGGVIPVLQSYFSVHTQTPKMDDFGVPALHRRDIELANPQQAFASFTLESGLVDCFKK